jgi:hypothetical protein
MHSPTKDRLSLALISFVDNNRDVDIRAQGNEERSAARIAWI